MNSLLAGIALLEAQETGGFPNQVAGVALLLAAISLAIGFLTPFFSAVTALSFVVSEMAQRHLIVALPIENFVFAADFITITIALAFIGPGAVSLDARLFGRREIIIPDPDKPRTK